ncbi:hypothetical protein BHE74_00010072 [Ensete ventricosum]|nr:hypothetical protein BHE74_00010072 [Ensete ventricosum]
MLYAKGSSTTIKGTMKVLVLGSSPKVMGRVATPTGVIASPINPVKVEVMGMRSRVSYGLLPGISFPYRGAIATRGWAVYYDVYLSLHGAFRAEGRLAWLSYIPVEVATLYEVLNLVLQIVALLGVVSVVAVEAIVASAVPFLSSSPHRVGGFEESFLPDLEETLGPGRVE